LPSLQGCVAPPTHTPPAHESSVVQASLSLHGSVLGANTQPLVASQLSFVHNLLSSQTICTPGAHCPPLHTSPDAPVHTLPSEHGAALFAWTQPFLSGQVSLVQGLPSSQFGVLLPLHRPSKQVSMIVHSDPSSQASVLAVCRQP